MKHWVQPVSGRSWCTFTASNATVLHLAGRLRKRATRLQPGDLLISYMLRVKRWVGVLEVRSVHTSEESTGPGNTLPPIIIDVTPLVVLPPEQGVPMEQLRGRLSFFQPSDTAQRWAARVRRSLSPYEQTDGQVIVAALRDAAKNPVRRPFDINLLERRNGRHRTPQHTDRTNNGSALPAHSRHTNGRRYSGITDGGTTRHTEIQWHLLTLGAQMGFDVWAPRNDRNRSWNGIRIGDAPKLLPVFPPLFNINPELKKTIENIDVLWLRASSIVAAFEVEHTTSIYSGLLRFCDMMAMNPVVNIKLYLVAPDERFTCFARQVTRPTFHAASSSFLTACRFLPYSSLIRYLNRTRDTLRYLKPDFLDGISIPLQLGK